MSITHQPKSGATLTGTEYEDDDHVVSGFTDYTPALTASTSDPTLGTGGTIAGRYTQIGKNVTVHVGIAFGTAGTAAGSGTFYVSLPVNMRTPMNDGAIVGYGWIYDKNVTRSYMILATYESATTVRLRNYDATNFVTNSSPITWSAEDAIQLSLNYEAE